MNAGGRALIILAAVSLLLSSCATQSQKATPHPKEQTQTAEQPKQQPEKPADQQQTAAQSSGQEFVATAELYKRTFEEVQEVIAALNRIIAAKEYDNWLAYLTAEYVRITSSPQFLANASDSAVLKKNGIVLKNLQDYFSNVVVRSRVEAKLSDITFVDATHVKAITNIQDTPVILYYLVREDGRWKVGILEHAQN
jgi:hypothetical protein